MFNPHFTKKSKGARALIGEMLDMVSQAMTGTELVIKRVSAETMALGWDGLLRKLVEACRSGEHSGVILTGWQVNGRIPQIKILPASVLRYAPGRLTPRDAFGRRLLEVFQVLRDRPKTPSLEQDQAMVLAFARAKASLDALSIELAGKAGKTGREYPVFTLRGHDAVPQGEAWISAITLLGAKREAGDFMWLQRHPLPTRVRVTLVAKAWIPAGTICINPVVAQEGMSADFDGDQCHGVKCWGVLASLVGPETAAMGQRDLASTPLAGWLKQVGLKKKLFLDSLLVVPVEQFADVVTQLAQFSVAGIGQVGYNPALVMAMLALLNHPGCASLQGFGYRRLYEDVMLAGMTEDRWKLFEIAKDLSHVDLVNALQENFATCGLDMSTNQVEVFVKARAIGKAVSTIENDGLVSAAVKEHMGDAGKHMRLYGLLRAVDGERLTSVFLPQWEAILAEYPADLQIIQILREVCPLMVRAQRLREARKERVERATSDE